EGTARKNTYRHSLSPHRGECQYQEGDEAYFVVLFRVGCFRPSLEIVCGPSPETAYHPLCPAPSRHDTGATRGQHGRALSNARGCAILGAPGVDRRTAA